MIEISWGYPFELFPSAVIGLGAPVLADRTPEDAIDAADAGYTNERAIRLTVPVTSGGLAIAEVRLSESGDFTSAAWSTDFILASDGASLACTYTLAEGEDNQRTLYVQARSAQAVASNTVSGKITLDRVAPNQADVDFTEGAYTAEVKAHLLPACAGADYMRLISLASDVLGWDAGDLDTWVPYSPRPVGVTLSGGNGEKTVRVRYRDKAGNLSPEVSTAISYSDDAASAPRNLDSDHADDGEWTAYTGVHTFTWLEPDSIGESGIKWYRYTTDGTVPTAESPHTASGSDRQFTFDPADSTDQYLIRVRAEMNNGLLGNYAEFALWVDTSGLRLTVVSPVPGAVLNDTQPQIVCLIQSSGESTLDESSLRLTVAGVVYTLASPAIRWDADLGQLTFDPSLLDPAVEYGGAVACTLQAATHAGASATVSWSFVIDLDAPSFGVEYFLDAECTTAIPADRPLRAKALYLRITADREMQATPTFSVNQPGSLDAFDLTTTPLASAQHRVFVGRYDIQPHAGTLYVDGTAHLTVSGVSLAGNLATNATPTAGDTFDIDTTAPAVALSLIGQDPLHLHHADVTFRAAFNEPVENVMLAVVTDGGALILPGQPMTDTGGNVWAFDWYIPTLPQGAYRVVIEAFDRAGNRNADPTNASLFYDTTPPRLYAVQVVPQVASTVLGYNLVAIGFRSNEPLDASGVQVLVNGQHATLAGFSSNSTRWGFEYLVGGDEPEGPAPVVITATDLAGNVTTVTTSVIFDFTAPTITVTKPSADNVLLDDDPLALTWDWADANGIDLGQARVSLNGQDITNRCVLTTAGGAFVDIPGR